MEAHWRPQTYWPGHAKIHMDLPVKGVSAGAGLVFDDSLTLDMSTGVAYVGTVDAKTLKMTVTSRRPAVRHVYPVSLGATKTPTAHGIKVIMEKGLDIEMKGPGYDDPHVKYTQRLTYGGEYLHSAPWNVAEHRAPQHLKWLHQPAARPTPRSCTTPSRSATSSSTRTPTGRP